MRLDPLNPSDPVEITPKDFELQVRDWLTRGAMHAEDWKATHQEKVAGQGGEYAVDVVVRLTLFSGALLVVLAECKHQGRPVARDEVLALESKLRDTGAHKGMLFSTSGFQEGAIKLARARGIATITVVEGRWLYETRSLYSDSVVPPPWANLPRFAGQRLTPLENGYSCHTIDDEQVHAILDFLNTTS
ncbi:MAG: hypothetical protein JWO19_1930 [Bryobacterales bacterium]|nr:hypothetical protein [Bryobacterales bacterium]